MSIFNEGNRFHRFLWFCPCSNDLKIFNAKKLIKTAKELHANIVHFPATGASSPDTVKAFYHSNIIEQPEWMENRDLLAEAIDEGKKHNIQIVAYFNGHWYPSEFFKNRADWAMLSADQKRIDLGSSYGSGEVPCVNSPGFKEYSLKIMEEISKNYDIAGIFLDGPVFRPEGCYCGYCRDGFKSKYAAAIPAQTDWNNPHWYKFLDFRYDSMFSYFSPVQEKVKKIKNIPVYKNAAVLTTTWFGCLDIEKFSPYIDLIGAEHFVFYLEPIHVPHWGAAAVAKYESAVGEIYKKPASVFLCYGHKVWDYYPLPAADMKLLIAETAANGAYPFVTIDDYQLVNDSEKLQPIGEMYSFIEKHESAFCSESANPVALVWSNNTADYYTRSTLSGASGSHHYEVKSEKEYLPEFRGFYEALAQAHIPFDIIGNIHLEKGKLDKYSLLILPNTACLSKSAIQEIRNFVENGGNIISSFETSLYNEFGEKQTDFQLADILGVSLLPKEKNQISNKDYQQITANHDITRSMIKKFIPVPEENIMVKVNSGKYKMLTQLLVPLPYRYHPLGDLTDYPGLVVGKFGKGKVAYFSGLIGQLFYKYRIRDIRNLITQTANWMSGNIPQIQAPASVEVNLRKNQTGYFIHLVNWSTRLSRPVEDIVPVKDIKIEFRIPQNKKIKTVRLLSNNKKLQFQQMKNNIIFTLPELKEYDIIHLVI